MRLEVRLEDAPVGVVGEVPDRPRPRRALRRELLEAVGHARELHDRSARRGKLGRPPRGANGVVAKDTGLWPTSTPLSPDVPCRTMKLTFKSRYLSLQELPDTSLPTFTLVTGLNGAGKTHLLRAIESGAVGVDIAPDPRTDIKYFDWTSLHPNELQTVTSASLYQQRDQVLEWIQTSRREHDPALSDLLARYSVQRKWARNPWDIGRASPSQLEAIINDEPTRDTFVAELRTLLKVTTNTINQHVNSQQNPALWAAVSGVAGGIANSGGTFPVLIRESDFHDKHVSLGTADIFQQSLAQLFLAYFELQKLNRLNRMEIEDGRTPPAPYLPDEEFCTKHGLPPWDFVNRSLESAGLAFRIDHPIEWTTSRYVPTLAKVSSGVTMPFAALSSGEKVLMSFALCLYYSTDRRQIVTRPKLLLLDEIDAPLHPSMSRLLLNVITNTLVKDEGISVIMTTHSPSTAAVAPVGSLFTMKPEIPGLHAATRGQAVSLLTADIPVLAITFDGRRQVFVESALDAERYEKLFSNLRADIQHERSLVFVGVGSRSKNGDRDAGCAQVTRIVNELTQAGNISVFGLLDWDTKNRPTPRVHVVGYEERYSIENCLLDPLLVAALAIREDRACGTGLGLTENESYNDLASLSPDRLQQLADVVQLRVLNLADATRLGEKLRVTYLRGLVLELSKAYLHHHGHTLEDLVKAAFPHLRKYHRSGDMLMRIIDPVVVEMRHLVPAALVSAMQGILNTEIE